MTQLVPGQLRSSPRTAGKDDVEIFSSDRQHLSRSVAVGLPSASNVAMNSAPLRERTRSRSGGPAPGEVDRKP